MPFNKHLRRVFKIYITNKRCNFPLKRNAILRKTRHRRPVYKYIIVITVKWNVFESG